MTGPWEKTYLEPLWVLMVFRSRALFDVREGETPEGDWFALLGLTPALVGDAFSQLQASQQPLQVAGPLSPADKP